MRASFTSSPSRRATLQSQRGIRPGIGFTVRSSVMPARRPLEHADEPHDRHDRQHDENEELEGRIVMSPTTTSSRIGKPRMARPSSGRRAIRRSMAAIMSESDGLSQYYERNRSDGFRSDPSFSGSSEISGKQGAKCSEGYDRWIVRLGPAEQSDTLMKTRTRRGHEGHDRTKESPCLLSGLCPLCTALSRPGGTRFSPCTDSPGRTTARRAQHLRV